MSNIKQESLQKQIHQNHTFFFWGKQEDSAILGILTKILPLPQITKGGDNFDACSNKGWEVLHSFTNSQTQIELVTTREAT